jgi:4-amino-4-deoxy-L-arabinose transferase-like glycosyltransferase
MDTPGKIQGQPLIKGRGMGLLVAVFGILVIMVIVTWLNLPLRPDMSRLPPDSGFYAYFGKAILHGQVLYRDLWDDKPPLGYYLNALALGIFGQTPWGVWWSGVVWITGCTLLLFVTIKKLFGWVPSGIISFLFLILLMNREIFQGSNMMEVYALAPQIGLIGIAYLYFNKKHNALFAGLAGALTSSAYLIKQPTVVLGFASLGLMLISSLRNWKIRQAFLVLISFGLGCLSVIGLVSLYWFVIGAQNSFFDGAILQGFSFAGGSDIRLSVNYFYALINVLPKLYIGKLFLVALLFALIFLFTKLYTFWLKPIFSHRLTWLEWCIVVGLILVPVGFVQILHGSHSKTIGLSAIIAFGLFFLIKYYRNKDRISNQEVFNPIEYSWMVGVVALPFEPLMASLGGRYFGHYFITMIPSVCLVIAYPIWKIATISKKIYQEKWSILQFSLFSILLIPVLIWTIGVIRQEFSLNRYTHNLAGLFSGRILENDLEEYISQTTRPEDEVLVWHIHLGINFDINRKSPTRFLFPLNLFIPPTAQNTRLQEYVDDLEADPPELILVQKNSSIALPFVDQPTDQLCQTYCTPEFVQAMEVPAISQQWERLEEFFYAHYTLDTRIYDWTIYRRLPLAEPGSAP